MRQYQIEIIPALTRAEVDREVLRIRLAELLLGRTLTTDEVLTLPDRNLR